MSGEHLDICDDPFDGSNASAAPTTRPFVGVHFTCCDVYTRVYLNGDETAFQGNCPKCGKRVRLEIGPGGTDSRFFTAR
jgi:hypothetical protein